MKKVLLCLVLACLAAVPAMANSLITIGNPPDPGAGNSFPFGSAYNAEYQQVYGSSDFNTGPIQIMSLEVYNTQFNNGATETNLGTYTISLSTTQAGVNNISGTFADNIGLDNTTVFTGSINQAWNFGDTLHISFSKPFTYDPTKGNLLLDVVGQGISVPTGNIYFDVNSTGGYFTRVYCPGGQACQTGVPDTGYGLVTGFDYTSVPEPGTLVMLGTGLLGAVGVIRRRIL